MALAEIRRHARFTITGYAIAFELRDHNRRGAAYTVRDPEGMNKVKGMRFERELHDR